MVRIIRSRSRVPRIGLLTYHRSVNDGSIIQAWCLYQLLQRALPEARIEIIDYMPMSLHRRHVRLALYGSRPPFFNPRYLWSYRNQQWFLSRWCRFSSRRFVSDDLVQAQEFIGGLDYDAVVTGSDTIWEIERHPRPPNAYFRPCTTTPTFAFAASADPVPGPQGSCYADPVEVRRAIECFDGITVRDEATRALLERLGIASDRISHLPDPTLLVDFSQHLGTPRLPGAGARPLSALAGSPTLARALLPLIVKAGFQVVSLMGSRQLNGVLSLPTFSTIGERLGLYPSIDLTITDRFHMTIFALKHGRGPVIFLEDTSRWPEPASKGRDLLTRLGLQEMVWRIDDKDVDEARLAAMLDAWPLAAQGLRERLARLRINAEADDYGGIGTALRAIVDAKDMFRSQVAQEASHDVIPRTAHDDRNR